MSEEQNQWFKSWFDTEEYHELYGHRDYTEAEKFIAKLVEHLKIPKGANCVDLACGKGRHSNTLAQLGMNVLGLDLSINSIQYAQANALKGSRFLVHDMRDILPIDNLDYIFNLFTSFGYFESPKTDETILSHQFEALNTNGIFVQDYLNAASVINQLPQHQTIEKPTKTYQIEKFIEAGFVKKQIQFTRNEEQFTFVEQVKIYKTEELMALHEKAGFKILNSFGDYKLNSFNEATSPRIIIISKKC